jgi:hypothetical protein
MIYLVGCEAIQVKEGCGCRRAKGIQEQRQTEDCHIFQAAIIKVKIIIQDSFKYILTINQMSIFQKTTSQKLRR